MGVKTELQPEISCDNYSGFERAELPLKGSSLLFPHYNWRMKEQSRILQPSQTREKLKDKVATTGRKKLCFSSNGEP